MLHDSNSVSFDRLLDEAIADPDQLDALRRAISTRIGALDLGTVARRPPVAKGPRTAVAADPNDDSLWDNMPV